MHCGECWPSVLQAGTVYTEFQKVTILSLVLLNMSLMPKSKILFASNHYALYLQDVCPHVHNPGQDVKACTRLPPGEDIWHCTAWLHLLFTHIIYTRWTATASHAERLRTIVWVQEQVTVWVRDKLPALNSGCMGLCDRKQWREDSTCHNFTSEVMACRAFPP